MGVHRVLRGVRLGDRHRQALRQLVLLAPEDGGVHPRPRDPAPRRVLVHRAGHEVDRAVVAGRGGLRARRPRVRRQRHPALRRPGRRGHRHPDVPPGVAPRARPRGRVRPHRRGPGRHLHGVVGAAAADRRALPARAAVGGRGARQPGGSSSARRDPGADVAVGQHPRHLRARLRLPRPAPARPLGRRAPTLGGARALAARRLGDRVRPDLPEPLRPRPVALPARPAVARRDPLARHRVAVPRLPQVVGPRARAVDRGLRVGAGARSSPGDAPRPDRHHPDAAARAVGRAQRGHCAAGRACPWSRAASPATRRSRRPRADRWWSRRSRCWCSRGW